MKTKHFRAEGYGLAADWARTARQAQPSEKGDPLLAAADWWASIWVTFVCGQSLRPEERKLLDMGHLLQQRARQLSSSTGEVLREHKVYGDYWYPQEELTEALRKALKATERQEHEVI